MKTFKAGEYVVGITSRFYTKGKTPLYKVLRVCPDERYDVICIETKEKKDIGRIWKDIHISHLRPLSRTEERKNEI